MIAVVQRVQEAWVRVAAEEVARIGPGLLVLAGVAADDGPADVAYLAQKLAHLRVFAGVNAYANAVGQQTPLARRHPVESELAGIVRQRR